LLSAVERYDQQFRPFFTNQDLEVGSRYNMIYRHIMTGMGNFFRFSLGLGYIPDLRIIQLGNVIGEHVFILNNQN